MPAVDSSALITWCGSKLSSKNAAASRSPPSDSTDCAPAQTPFQASCFSRTGHPRWNASRAGRTGSLFHAGRSIQEAGCRRPRYSTGGVGAGAVAGAAGGAGHSGFSMGGQISGAGAAARGCGTGGGVVAQPAATQTAATANARAAMEDNAIACTTGTEAGVGWVFFEIGLALAIAVLIVWWTLPRKPRAPEDEDER